ncbi:M20/M25/M40 family metallo-hydrolase [Nonomuraea sp. NPDC048826]|uniref:M20/M25/M40 family metallo-hydrolase n=1 Tax=Nonomuraea sp. NPDC048826 TaxID=3364347 RepID=UPI003723B0C7
MPRTALAGLVALAGLLALTLFDLAPPSPVSASAPSGAFSAERAYAHVQAVAKAPHPTGSAEHARVRDHLVAELRALDLDVRVQEGVGVLPIDHTGAIPMGTMRNIVAVRPGTASTGRVVLAAHYDSVAAAPGAADDGAGVATILEVARALPRDHKNDVVFLITDGEEQGLLGAEAFAREDPLAKGTVVVVNNEARGVRGTVQTFRAAPGAGPLISLYGATVPHPSADSAFAALLTLLPNNTDFHVFDEAGWLGLDSAFIGGGAYYHTPLDDPAHLDRASLQQMGDNSLALVRALADADLPALRTGEDAVYFTVPGLLVRYPLGLELPLAAGAVVLAGVLVWRLRLRRDVTLPRVAAATGLALVPVLAAAGLGYATMPLLAVFRPEYSGLLLGDPYRPWLYQAALLVATLAVVLTYRVALRRLGPASLAVGGVLLVAVLGLASAAALPGGAHSFTWPALFAALGWLVHLRLGRTAQKPASADDAPRAGWRASLGPVVALTLGLVPAAILLGGTAVASLDVGLTIGGMIAAPHFALMLLLMLPLIERALPALDRRRALRSPAVAVALTAALVAAGLAVDRFDAAHPRQARVAYALDTATGQALWGRRGEAAKPEDSVRFFGDDGWTTTPARAAALKSPEVQVLKDETTGDLRTLTLRLTPSGATPIVGLAMEPSDPAKGSPPRTDATGSPPGTDATGSPPGTDTPGSSAAAGAPGSLTDADAPGSLADADAPGSLAGPITVAGRELATATGFTYHAPPGPLEVTLVLHPGPALVRVFERTPDLSSMPGFAPEPETVNMSPAATAFRVHTF